MVALDILKYIPVRCVGYYNIFTYKTSEAVLKNLDFRMCICLVASTSWTYTCVFVRVCTCTSMLTLSFQKMSELKVDKQSSFRYSSQELIS